MSKDSIARPRDSGALSGTGEHFLSRVLVGDSQSAGSRLAEAVEQLGYYVLREEPLEARRGARGLASWLGSNSVLNYSIALTIAVKPLGVGATRVTFGYMLNHRLLTSNGRQTLTREAEAIIALAAMRSAASTCIACGATAAIGSRFCRRCGTPSVLTEPAELEVLRVTADLCAGYTRTIFGAVSLALAFLTLLLGLTTTLLSFSSTVALSSALAILGWALLFAGLFRLHRSLNPKSDDGARAVAAETRSDNRTPFAAEDGRSDTSSLEKTTELLPAAPEGSSSAIAQRDVDGV